MRGTDYHYWFTADAVAMVGESEPDDSHLSGRVLDEDEDEPVETLRLRGCIAEWVIEGDYAVVIPAANVLTMEGNQWNFEHARAIANEMRRRTMAFGLPAARVYVVDADDVVRTQELAGEGDYDTLLDEYGLLRPWGEDEIGTLKAQLLDGNHRAVAALWLGDDEIVVYVGPNYRENVPDDMWLRNG